MTTANGSPGRYSVDLTGMARADYLEAIRAAEAVEAGRAVIDGMGRVLERLRRDPREFGEPMYHLDAMRMEVRNAATASIYIEYGVHDDQPVVLIRRVRWLGPTA